MTESSELLVVRTPKEPHKVVDIRPPSTAKTLTSMAQVVPENIPVLHVPYYELAKYFETLSVDSTYLLYCDSGIMSRVQAAHLRARGHGNVGVFEPDVSTQLASTSLPSNKNNESIGR